MQNANIANLICKETFVKHIDRIQSANIHNYIFLLAFDLKWILKSNKNIMDSYLIYKINVYYILCILDIDPMFEKRTS